MLNYHSGISDERPEVVRTEARIPLQMIKECVGVSVVIRKAMLFDPEQLLPDPGLSPASAGIPSSFLG